MKKFLSSKFLPAVTLLLGAVGFLLRLGLYAVAPDGKGLLPKGHPLELLLWAVTAVAMALVIAAAWNAKGSNRYADNFGPSLPGAMGNILMAAGILLTVLLKQPKMPNLLGVLWKVLGFVSAPCLVAAAFARVQGKRPFFLLHMSACLFLVFHIVNHYQTWSGDPQLQNYLFTLLGTMALMFFGFYTAAFEVGSGRRRMLLGMGLAAVYLCAVSLSSSEYPFLYLGGIVWVLTNQCTLKPEPVRQPEEREEEK
ncbi:MAG: hypothetical protein ACI4PH_05415 [Faecousia sp.]